MKAEKLKPDAQEMTEYQRRRLTCSAVSEDGAAARGDGLTT